MNPLHTTGSENNSYDAGHRCKDNSQFVQNTSAGDFFEDDVAKAIHGRMSLSGPPTPSPEPSEFISSTTLENKKEDIQSKEMEREAEGNRLREIEVPEIKIMDRDVKQDEIGIYVSTQPNQGEKGNESDGFAIRETVEGSGRALSETRRGEIDVDEDDENDGKSHVGSSHGHDTAKDNLRENEAEDEDNGSEVSYPTSLDDDDDERQRQTATDEQQRSHATTTKRLEKKGSEKETNRIDLDWDQDKEEYKGDGEEDKEFDEDRFMLDEGGWSFAIMDLDLDDYDYEEAEETKRGERSESGRDREGGEENVRDSFGTNGSAMSQEAKAGGKDNEKGEERRSAERANTSSTEGGEEKGEATGDFLQVGEQTEKAQKMDLNGRIPMPRSYASRHSPAGTFGSTHLRRKESLAIQIAASSAPSLEKKQVSDPSSTTTQGDNNDVTVNNTAMALADKKDEQIIDIEGIELFGEIREADPFVLVDETFATFCDRVSSGADIDKMVRIKSSNYDNFSSGGIPKSTVVAAKPTYAEFADNMLREYTAKWREEERRAREVARAKAKAKAAVKAKEAVAAASEKATEDIRAGVVPNVHESSTVDASLPESISTKVNVAGAGDEAVLPPPQREKVNEENDGRDSEKKVTARRRSSISTAAAPLRNPSTEKLIAKVPTTRPSASSNRPSSPTTGTKQTFNGFDRKELMREARDAYESKFKKERCDEREMRHQLRDERQHYAHLKGKESSLRETYEEKRHFRELADHSQASASPLTSSQQNVEEKFACGDTFLSEIINERMRSAALDAMQKCRKQREDKLGDNVDDAGGGQEGQQQQEVLTDASAKMAPTNDELATLLTPLNLSFAGSAASTTTNFYEKDLAAKAGSAGGKSNKLRTTIIPPPRTSSIASLLESDLYQKTKLHGEYLHKPRVELYTSAQNARFTATGWFGKRVSEVQHLGGSESKKAAAWAYTCGPLEIVKKEKKSKLTLSPSSAGNTPLHVEDQPKEKGMVDGDLDTTKTSEEPRGEKATAAASSSTFTTAAPVGELPKKTSLSDPALVTNKQIAHAPPSLRRLLYEHYNMDVHSRYAYLQKNDEEQEKEELRSPPEGKHVTSGAAPSEHKIDVSMHGLDVGGGTTREEDAEHPRKSTELEKQQLQSILSDVPRDQEVTTIVLNAFAPGVNVSDSNKIGITTPPPKPTTDLSTAILLAKHRPICPFTTNANKKNCEESQNDLQARRSSPSRRDAVNSTTLKKSKSSNLDPRQTKGETDAPLPPPNRSRSKSIRAENSITITSLESKSKKTQESSAHREKATEVSDNRIKTSTNDKEEKRNTLKSSASTSSVSETLPKKRQRSMSRAAVTPGAKASSPLASSHASFSSATFSQSPSRSSAVLNSASRRKKDAVSVVAPNETPENINNKTESGMGQHQQMLPDFELIADHNDNGPKDQQRVPTRKGKNTMDRRKVNLTGYISGEDSNEDEQDVITTFTVVGLKRNQMGQPEIVSDRSAAYSVLRLENEQKSRNASAGMTSSTVNERPSLPENRGAMISLLPQIPSYATLNTEKAQKCYQDLLAYIHSQYKYTNPSTSSSTQWWGAGGGKKATADNNNSIAKAVNLAERALILGGKGSSLYHHHDVDGYSVNAPPPALLMPPFGIFPSQTYEY